MSSLSAPRAPAAAGVRAALPLALPTPPRGLGRCALRSAAPLQCPQKLPRPAPRPRAAPPPAAAAAAAAASGEPAQPAQPSLLQRLGAFLSTNYLPCGLLLAVVLG